LLLALVITGEPLAHTYEPGRRIWLKNPVDRLSALERVERRKKELAEWPERPRRERAEFIATRKAAIADHIADAEASRRIA
jgi:hypothetical protein